MTLRTGTLAVLCAFVAASAGCGKEVEVVVDRTLVGKSVEVHVVGVAPVDGPRWRAKSMTAYWEPDDTFRIAAVGSRPAGDSSTEGGQVYLVTFGPEFPTSHVLRHDHPIWSRWQRRGATSLYALAKLPGTHTDRDGEADTRRSIYAIKHWPPHKKLRVDISVGGVSIHKTAD